MFKSYVYYNSKIIFINKTIGDTFWRPFISSARSKYNYSYKQNKV